MKVEKIKEDVIRAEGYAEGFRAGYVACAQRIVDECAKEEAAKSKNSENSAGGTKPESSGASS